MIEKTIEMLGLQQKILVVEDDPDILRIITNTLSGAGYRVTPAYGAADGLRKVKRDNFHLVLTDLAMPKMSGVELIEALKQDPDTRHIPVIAVTAYWMDRLGDSASEVGCDGYLNKPFRTNELLALVAKHLSMPHRPHYR